MLQRMPRSSRQHPSLDAPPVVYYICMYVHMYVCIYISPSPVVANVVAVLLVGAGYFNNVLWFWQHLNSAFV